MGLLSLAGGGEDTDYMLRRCPHYGLGKDLISLTEVGNKRHHFEANEPNYWNAADYTYKTGTSVLVRPHHESGQACICRNGWATLTITQRRHDSWKYVDKLLQESRRLWRPATTHPSAKIIKLSITLFYHNMCLQSNKKATHSRSLCVNKPSGRKEGEEMGHL